MMNNECKTPRRSCRLQIKTNVSKDATPSSALKGVIDKASDLIKLVSPLSIKKKRTPKSAIRDPAMLEKKIEENLNSPMFGIKLYRPLTTLIKLVSPPSMKKKHTPKCAIEDLEEYEKKKEEHLNSKLFDDKQDTSLTTLNVSKAFVDNIDENLKITSPLITKLSPELIEQTVTLVEPSLATPTSVTKELIIDTFSAESYPMETILEVPDVIPNDINISPVKENVAIVITNETQEDSVINSTFTLTNENENIEDNNVLESNEKENKFLETKPDNSLTKKASNVPFLLKQREDIFTGNSDNVTKRNGKNKINNIKVDARRKTMTPIKKTIKTLDLFKPLSSTTRKNSADNVFKNITHIQNELSTTKLINENANKLSIKSIRKRSLSTTDTDPIKKNNRVKFFSPLNSEMQIDLIDKKMKLNNTPSKVLNKSDNFIAKKRERSQSNIETKSDFNLSLKFPCSPGYGKVPNFAAIHNKEFNKMESIVEHSERKNERAKNLFTVKVVEKPLLTLEISKIPISSNVSRTTQGVKNATNKVTKRNQRNIKLFKNRPNVEEAIKTVIKKKQSDILHCVRTNRRFDLMMEFRKLNDNK